MGLSESINKSLNKHRRKGPDTTHVATTGVLAESSTPASHRSRSPLRRRLLRALRLNTDKQRTNIPSVLPIRQPPSLTPHDTPLINTSDDLASHPLASSSDAPISPSPQEQGFVPNRVNADGHNDAHDPIQTTNQRLTSHEPEAFQYERIEDVTDEHLDLPHAERQESVSTALAEHRSSRENQPHISDEAEETANDSDSNHEGSSTSISHPGQTDSSSTQPSSLPSIPPPSEPGSRPESQNPSPSPGTLVVVQGIISSRRIDASPIIPSNPSPIHSTSNALTEDISTQPSTATTLAPAPLPGASPFTAHSSSNRASHRRSLTQTARQLISSTFRRRSMAQPSPRLSEFNPETAPHSSMAGSSSSPQSPQSAITTSVPASTPVTSPPTLSPIGSETIRSDNETDITSSDNLDVLGSIVSIATAATAASLILDETRTTPTPTRSWSSGPSGLNLNMLSIAQALLAANATIPTILRPEVERSSRMRSTGEPESFLNSFGSLGGPFVGVGRERESFRNSASSPGVGATAAHSLLGGIISHLPTIIGGQTAQHSSGPSATPSSIPIRTESGHISSIPRSPTTRPAESETSSPETFSQFLSGVQSDIRFVFSEMDSPSGDEPAASSSPARPSDVNGVAESIPVRQSPIQSDEGTSEPSPTPPGVRGEDEPSRGTLPSSIGTNIDGVQRAGINNWRVHRFAPMPVSRQISIAPNTAQGNVSGSEGRDAPDLMTPVVFVGLQRIRPDARDSTPDSTVFNPNNPIQSSDNQNPTNPSVPLEDVPEALPPSATQAPLDRTTSRAFFIYIYGGFFPLDHPVVTGSGNLDSFEALWELIDWLGQMKPAVVTQEEINKSGLVTFKAKDFPAKQKNEEVSDNCVDKCLVCLEDYVPEDDVRLLTCRHAFHTACVDTWLQTGKNNCPACRAPGVGASRGSMISSL